MSAKTTYQRSAKGPVSISECAADGRYVALENTGRKEESLSGWRLKRVIDGMEKADQTLDKLSLRPGGKVKIFSAGQRPGNASPSDIEVNLQTWGIGANITTKLINPAGEVQHTSINKTSVSRRCPTI